jgi:hypothetical protein
MPKYRVAWLDDADFRPATDPETIIEAPDEIARSFPILSPFGRGTDTVLTIHAYRSGNIFASEAPVSDVMECHVEPSQSNPRRADAGEDEG